MPDTFSALGTLTVGQRAYRIARLSALERHGYDVARLPYSLRILLESLLRREDGETVRAEDIAALAGWEPAAAPATEIAFMPGRVLLQDFTGVPALVDLAAMRDAVAAMGGEPRRINPLVPVELVIDHSVQVDAFGSPTAFRINVERELERNRERYAFLKWGQQAFDNLKVVPPGTGICHQVNLEYLARVVMTEAADGEPPFAYPDTLVGTDSHTPMVNGLGVLGWGVGGIEAEAAMLGQPISMLIPQVVGVRLSGALAPGATATDLVLTVTEMLRRHGVVGKFVEFFGPGLASLGLADRATIGNMAPEYGATCGIFPVDHVSLDYLRLTGRPDERIALVEAYMKEQGLFHAAGSREPDFSQRLELDLASVEPSLAGPRRPQDRVALPRVKEDFLAQLPDLEGPPPVTPLRERREGRWESEGGAALTVEETVEVEPDGRHVRVVLQGEPCVLTHGSVVIAAITSCTNTSNPAVMIGAGLLAKRAVERGLAPRPWDKTTQAHGSKEVTDYLAAAGLDRYLDQLGFQLVGYGCTTCIGNSGPLPQAVADAVHAGELVAVSVLSGNRNFEGRISPDVRANYLASPPLVIAYALAGRIDIDLTSEPLGRGADGKPVTLADLWPAPEEIARTMESAIRSEMFRRQYGEVYTGDERWRELEVPGGDTYGWEAESTYVKLPPYFVALPRRPAPVADFAGARVLAVVGDSITTDHISPAGSIKAASPAGSYLVERGVPPADFNSYGSRRGNHEVMMRGTFANVRFRNRLVPDREGGWTALLPEGEVMPIFEAASRYGERGVPLLVLAGREYGSGSSRDWAAKGPALLGVRAVLAQGFERIHRSNLIGMGILPLELQPGDSVESLGLTGHEVFAVEGLAAGLSGAFRPGLEVTVRAAGPDGERAFSARVRLDTPQEARYYQHGGILPYVLRQLLQAS